jgi:FlaA1/EpsC-like NDP-sugar epimerase
MIHQRTLILILLPICLLATDIVAIFHLKEQLNYPYLVVEAENNVSLTILQHGSKSAPECETARSSYANALFLGCPTCRITLSKCADHLEQEQVTLLSAEPISTYSASIPNGVVNFVAANQDIAGAVCQESAKSRNGTNPNVLCFAPGTARPLLATTRSNIETNIQTIPAIWLAISVLIFAVWPYIYRHGQTGTLISHLIKLPRIQKQIFIAIVDVGSVELTLWLAFVLRLDTVFVPQDATIWLFLAAPLIAILVFARFGLYQSVIRYLGLQAMVQIAKAVGLYLILIVVATYLYQPDSVPRSVLPIHGALLLLLLCAVRGIARIWLTQSHFAIRGGVFRKSVAIYGAGSAGIQLANALAHSTELKPIAFLDDDSRLHKNRLGELEVYSPDRLGELIERFAVTEVMLAIPSVSRQRRREIIDALEKFPIQVRTLPALSDLAEGKIKTEDLREVDIDDLLGRDPVSPEPSLLKAEITGKSVMVTGAGGSIGSELCRQIVALQPRHLILFEQSEYALYAIDQELKNAPAGSQRIAGESNVIPIIGSVYDQFRIERIIRAYDVETIYHAAAYKHVPMVEHNPCEGVLNNVFGTYHTALAAINQKVNAFVLISTDKAVRPTNTMGATKRLAEMILQAFSSNHVNVSSRTRFSVVRFGNVLGSSGSVVPLFRDQLRRGGPITVTDPRIIRYFMTIPEAAQLVLQAGAMGKNGDIFVLDMGEPVKILDLARRMIRLSGLQLRNEENPAGDIEILFTGLRPGEKLYEELLTGDNPSKTDHPRIMRAIEKMIPLEQLEPMLSQMKAAALAGNSDLIRTLLLKLVEDYQPQCGNEDFIRSSITA